LLAEQRAKQHVQNAMEACAARGKRKALPSLDTR